MKKETYRILMVVGFYLAIITMLLTMITLVKNIKEIKAEPISYGIEKYNLRVCTCYDQKGAMANFDREGVITTQPGGWNVNLQE